MCVHRENNLPDKSYAYLLKAANLAQVPGPGYDHTVSPAWRPAISTGLT